MDANLWQRVDSRFDKIWSLRQQWCSLIDAPSTTLGTQKWVEKVIAVWFAARELNAPFVDPKSPLREFNESIGRMLEAYNTHSGGTEYLKEQGDKTLQVIEEAQAQHLQAEYRRACLDAESEFSGSTSSPGKATPTTSSSSIPGSTVYPTTSASVTASATAGPSTASNWPSDDHSHDCICGIVHPGGIPSCFYCIPEIRPRNFIKRERITQRIDQRIAADPRLQLYIDKARAKMRNGGRTPPPPPPERVVAAHLKVGNGTGTPREVASTAGGSQMAGENAMGSSVVVSSGPGLEIRSVTKEVSPPPHPMSKSWILSITSTICVCNHREALIDFEPVESGKTVLAHGQRMTVAGTGKAEVRVETPEGNEQIVTFPDVWYIPDYYTNIISLDALEEADVSWDHREGVLIMNDEPWCKVSRVHGMRVLQYTPVKGLDIL